MGYTNKLNLIETELGLLQYVTHVVPEQCYPHSLYICLWFYLTQVFGVIVVQASAPAGCKEGHRKHCDGDLNHPKRWGPEDVGIVMEGIKVLNGVEGVIMAFNMLFELIYALDLTILDNFKYTLSSSRRSS